VRSVDLDHLCSNKSTPVTADRIGQILAAAKDKTPVAQTIRRTRPWTRLSPASQAELVRRYSSGETSTALAEELKVAKSTVLRILRENSVVVRRQPLTAKQVSEAKHLYESGLSLSEVAERLKVNQETMRVAIIKAGVELRPPTQAKEAASAGGLSLTSESA
jgi:DNA-binding CsgD family transcriptional regulator